MMHLLLPTFRRRNASLSFSLTLRSLAFYFLLSGGCGFLSTSAQPGARRAMRVKHAHRIAKSLQPTRQTSLSSKGVQLYGCITDSYGDYWTGQSGLYTFNTSDASSFTLVQDNLPVYGGATYGDGKFFSTFYSESTEGVTFPIQLNQYDVNTWKKQKSSYGMAFSNIANDLAFDPTTGNLYGIFSDADSYGGYTTLGRVAYGENNTWTTQTVGQMAERMVALTFNSAGQLYAIGASGTFYSVDKHTANCTSIGETGFSPITFFQSATCDYKSGKVYWAAIYGDNWDTGIVEINPATGHGTLLTDWGTNGTQTFDQISGLFIKQDAQHAARPAAPTGVNVVFPQDGTLTGTISFTLPTKDVDGGSIASDLSYTVRANGTVIANGTAAPGSTVKQTVSVALGGYTTFSVTAGQDGAVSAEATTSVFIGNDPPASPYDVKAVMKNGDVALTWAAPDTTVKGGRLNTSSLVYRVTRRPDGVVVADSIQATALTDKVPADVLRKAYTYYVVAIDHTRESAAAPSNEVTVDRTLALPYNNSFDTQALFDAFTVDDANEDGNTWTYNTFTGSADCPGAAIPSDDWLITRPVYLDKGSLCRFSFTASNSYPVERVEAAVGSVPTAAGMITTIVQPTDITSTPQQHKLIGEFQAAEAGVYYFGIHAISPANRSVLHIDNVHIDATPATAPAAAAHLKALAGDKGAAYATLSFNAPATLVGGQALEDNVYIDIICDNDTIESLENVTPGKAITYRHNNVAPGLHTYSVVARLKNGTLGQSVSQDCYIGLDAPGEVTDLKAVEDLDKEGLIHVTWNAPVKGQHGGYVDPSSLTYYVSVGTQAQDVNVGSNTRYDEQLSVANKQTYQGYSVYAVNSIGSGRSVWRTVTAIAGPPLIAPVVESFADVTMKSGPWLPEMTSGQIGEAYWDAEGGQQNEGSTQDGDGGVLVFNVQAIGKSSRISSPKVYIGNVEKPKVNFWVYMTGHKDKLNVSASADYSAYQQLSTIVLDEKPKGWHRYSLSLDTYKDAHFVRIGFEGVSVETLTNVVAIDNISFATGSGADLMVGDVSAPAESASGKEMTISLKVRNNSSQAVAGEDYIVKLIKNSREVKRIKGTDVATDAIISLVLTDTPTVLDPEENSYQVVVYNKDDTYSPNDSSKVMKVLVNKPNYPSPTQLAVDNNAHLSWTAPNLDTQLPEATIDGFDNYTAFDITNFGNWQTVDRDGKNTIRITLNALFGPLVYPHAGEPMAFQVFNSEIAGIPYSSWDPHSGNQMLVSMSNAAEGGTTTHNDDWLISPPLYSGGQTISFYAKAGMGGRYVPEKLELFYSTTDDRIDSFEKVGETLDISNVNDWQKFSFDIPQGAKYFALHCVSEDKFALLIDDVSFIADDARPEEIVLNGYNVWRDSVVVASDIKDTSYTDLTANDGKDHVYQVTAVYDKGESLPSNAVRVSASGISDVSKGQSFTVSTTSAGILVKGLSPNTPIQVYTLAGALVAHTLHTSPVTKFALKPGIYVVKAAATAQKALVK